MPDEREMWCLRGDGNESEGMHDFQSSWKSLETSNEGCEMRFSHYKKGIKDSWVGKVDLLIQCFP